MDARLNGLSNPGERGRLRIAAPSDGVMHELTLDFLGGSGMRVRRPSARGYTGEIAAVPGAEVVFQRNADITARVEDGDADLGLVGFDNYAERRVEGGDAVVVIEALGYGRCELVVAVPDAWIDVDAMADLADVAVEFQESGRELRVATKYPSLTRRFLHRHDVNYFTLETLSGAVEPAPAIGYADFIVDLTASGRTLSENRLKRVADGVALESEGALIANRRSLRERPERLETAREFIERIEASRAAQQHLRVTANVAGESEEEVARKALDSPEAQGMSGPTVSRVYSPDGRSVYSVTALIAKRDLTAAVDHLRSIGGSSVSVSAPEHLFREESPAYRRLLAALGPA